MRGLIACIVVCVGFGRSVAAQPEESVETFDWEGDLDVDADELRAVCAEDPARCDELRSQCSSVTGYAHGTNVLILCNALGVTLADQDLDAALAAELLERCTAEPQGVFCASVRPMCVRNQDEGWPYPAIRDVCGAVREVGADWTAPPPRAPVEFDRDDVLDLERPLQLEAVSYCDEHPGECEPTRKLCRTHTVKRGGYLWGSHVAESCVAVGVEAPARDLHQDELDAAIRWCAEDAASRLCTSLIHACGKYDVPVPPTGYPLLGAACEAVWVAHPPPRIRSTPAVTMFGFGVALGRVAEPAQLGDAGATISIDTTAHGVNGRGPIGFGYAFRTTLGSTTDGGFLYDLGLGGGAGVRFGDGGMVMATIGGGLSGITGGHLGFAWTVPVELHVGIPLGSSLRLSLGARAAWLFKEAPRQDGAASVPMFDELEVRAGVTYLRATRRGYGVYAFASELRDTRVLGIAVGVGALVVETGEPRRAR